MAPPKVCVKPVESARPRKKGNKIMYKRKQASKSPVFNDAYIDRLPFELLGEIFSHYIRDATRRVPPGWPRRNPYKWLTITHVCRTWRAVALGTKKFWCNISLDRVDAAEAFIQRSGKKSLSVQGALWHGDSEDRKRLAVMKKHAGRIRALDLTISTGLLGRLGRKCGLQMIKLEELTLNRQFDRSHEDETKLLARFASRNLKKLALRQFAFASVDPILSSTITDLSLDTGTVLHAFSTQDMLGTLRKVPHLERLAVTVSYSAPQGAGVAATVQGPVILPALEELKMRISAAEDGKFLASIEVPALQVADFHLSCAGNKDIMPDVMKSIAPITNRLAKGMSQLKATVDGSPSTLDVTLSEDPECNPASPRQEVHLEFWHYGGSQSTVLQYAKDYLGPSLEVVKDLTVVDGPYPSGAASTWTSIFSLMSDVRNLRLCGDGILTMPDGFFHRQSDGTDLPLFPKLESTVLDSLDFLAARPELDAFMTGLIRSFECRANAQQTQNLTIINGIGTNWERYSALKNCVRKVLCNGIPSMSEGAVERAGQTREREPGVKG